MNNFSNQPPKKQIDPEFPISPQNALLLVAASIFLIGILGVMIRALMEAIFGEIQWNSPFLVLELLMIIPSVWLVNHYKLSIKQAFRFNHVSMLIVFLSVILGIAVAIIGDQLDRIVQKWVEIPGVFTEAVEKIFLTPNVVDFWFVLLIATFGAGICEEMLFRGFLQRIFEKKFQISIALLIPAILFGLIHLLPWLFIQVIMLGLVLGVLAWRTNSIYPTIIIHALNNFIGSLYIRFHTSEFDSYYLKNDLVNPTIVLIAIAVFILIGRLIWTITENTKINNRRFTPPDRKKLL